MLTYLWGDVLRILASEGKLGEIFETAPTRRMWLFMAALMMVPIVMVVLSLTLTYPVNRWANIIVPILVVVFNLVGFAGYPVYNKLLLGISFVFNALTVWYAWKWVA
jgi:hypothetical protein